MKYLLICLSLLITQASFASYNGWSGSGPDAMGGMPRYNNQGWSTTGSQAMGGGYRNKSNGWEYGSEAIGGNNNYSQQNNTNFDNVNNSNNFGGFRY